MTTHQHDAIIVIINLFTKVAHFSPMRSSYSIALITNVFMHDIVRFYGIPQKIILDGDLVFMYTFWTSLYHDLEAQLNFSSTYHPEIDG